jgi:nicotinate-nucleotide adenylyltransferase
VKIGLFPGSFNPIHIGHLLVAIHLKEKAQLDEIWFVVSPQNPFKANSGLAEEIHRLEMARLGVGDTPGLIVSDIEFSLPKPSYTHLTLKEITKQHPAHQFHLIIGQDNIQKFDEWKEATWIRENFPVLVYNRNANATDEINENNDSTFTLYKLPVFDVSSTNIRERIKNGLPVRFFVPAAVEQYIVFHKLYAAK